MSSIGLILTTPLLLVAGLAIRLESPGAAIFRQTRVGRDGQLFECWKLRTMIVDADPGPHESYVHDLVRGVDDHNPGTRSGSRVRKLTDDPRITRLGGFLRRASLDELPQLVNVLRGDMSLVGPRPSLPYEVELYEPWHRERLSVRPGMTGLWQIEGRSRVAFDDMVRLDVDYARRRSLWLDLKILARTPRAVISGTGAL